MVQKEFVAVCTFCILTFVPLGLTPLSTMVAWDFFPRENVAPHVFKQLEWLESIGMSNYVQNMSNIWIIFAIFTLLLAVSALACSSSNFSSEEKQTISAYRMVFGSGWYISCLAFLRGCLVLFPCMEKFSLGMWVGIVGAMVFTQMVLEDVLGEDEAAPVSHYDPANHPRVFLPSATKNNKSPVKAERVEEQVREEEPPAVEVQVLAEEDAGLSRGRSRRKTVSGGKSSRSKSRGKSRSKSRGATKTPGRTRGKKKSDDFVY